jgi:U3 small nucleolar RNA-associated protein 13
MHFEATPCYYPAALLPSQIRLYDLATRACTHSLIGHTDIVLCLDASTGPSGQPLLASAGKDHSVRIWDLSSGACIANATGHSAAVGALAFSRRGCKFLVTGASDRTLKYWTLEKLFEKGGVKSQAVVAAHDKDINTVAVAPNDSLACTGSQVS